MPAPIFQQQFDQRAAVAASRGETLPAKTASKDSGDDGFSFDDFLDIINPLQHLPVISTIYRAITHDTIKPIERIAGDTLYGGLWGFVSSVANIAFEKITGKDFGDTALALLTGDKTDAPATGVAAAAPAQQVASAATAAPARLSALASTGQQSGLDLAQTAPIALAAAMQARNVPSDVGQRALAAYQRAVELSQPPYGALAPIF